MVPHRSPAGISISSSQNVPSSFTLGGAKQRLEKATSPPRPGAAPRPRPRRRLLSPLQVLMLAGQNGGSVHTHMHKRCLLRGFLVSEGLHTAGMWECRLLLCALLGGGVGGEPQVCRMQSLSSQSLWSCCRYSFTAISCSFTGSSSTSGQQAQTGGGGGGEGGADGPPPCTA